MATEKVARYKIGMTVMLRSGGPVMTVSSVYPHKDKYDCQWFDGNELKEGTFPEDSLKLHYLTN